MTTLPRTLLAALAIATLIAGQTALLMRVVGS
jgi:hypothetical protein